MNKLGKKLIIALLTGALTVGSVTTAFAAGSTTYTPSTGTDSSSGTESGSESGSGSGEVISTDYVSKVNASATTGETVTTSKSGKAAITAVKKTSKKSVTIKSKVTVDGVSYTVTRVAGDAFKKNKQLTKVTLPSTITTISKNAFAGLKNLKTISLPVKKDITVRKGAFGKINTKKMTIKVSSKTSKAQLKKLKKTFKAAGFKGTVKRA